MIVDSGADLVLEQEVPDILCSALSDDCIARGKHLKEGGAVYDFISGLQVGIANLADSLAAIRKLGLRGATADARGALARPDDATSQARGRADPLDAGPRTPRSTATTSRRSTC